MKNFSNQKKSLNCVTQPAIGYFGIEHDKSCNITWYQCREKFAVDFTKDLKGFYFSHYHDKSLDTASFLNKFEEIIQINDFSFFSKTEKPTITWIEPSSFWKICYIKRSLFSILLRCSINYHLEKDNFDDVLFGNYKECSYIKDTKVAFMRFMFGFTEYAGKNVEIQENATVFKLGWREIFKDMDLEMVKLCLVSPNKNENAYGMDVLWN